MSRSFLRSETPGVVPNASQLNEGGIFFNLADGNVYSKDSNDNITLVGKVYPLADESTAGLVSTGSQRLSGTKTIVGDLKLED